jgi:two-component system, OmpR family, alkaline phosphatase synthesis response regulator PhoP
LTDTKKRILVVEDEPLVRMALRLRLEKQNYAVIESEDGEDGLNIARSEKPDLILLDVMLPKMDGNEMARLLKSDEKLRHIPIVMLTAKAQQADRDAANAAGADAYLTKPFKAEELLAAISMLLPSGQND